MRIIPTRVHGVIDYLVGVLLIAIPWLGRFADGGPEQWVPVAVGIAVLGQSLFTDYELGAVRLIPMPVHLMLDIGVGIFLAASPWLFGFAAVVWWPHLIVGLLDIGTAALTDTVPDRPGLPATINPAVR